MQYIKYVVKNESPLALDFNVEQELPVEPLSLDDLRDIEVALGFDNHELDWMAL